MDFHSSNAFEKIKMAENIFSTLGNVSRPPVELNSTQLVCWSSQISRLMLILRHIILHSDLAAISCNSLCISNTYTSLIDGNIKLGRMDHAFDLLSKMFDEGCQPNYQIYCLLMSCIVQENKIQKGHVIPDEDAIGSSDHGSLDEIQSLDGMPHEISIKH